MEQGEELPHRLPDTATFDEQVLYRVAKALEAQYRETARHALGMAAVQHQIAIEYLERSN